MMTRSRKGRGFTLIEMLVVIGIIAVLAAIILPVYSRAQEKARQADCISHLHAVAVAIKMYRMDEGKYPQQYNKTTGIGGITALYDAGYLTNYKALRCKDDQVEDVGTYNTNVAPDPVWDADKFKACYTSYNQNMLSGTEPLLYNYNGYDSSGYDQGSPDSGWNAKYKGLINSSAPDETIITHCPYHRVFYSGAAQLDLAVRVGGDVDQIKVSGYDWDTQP